MNQLSYSKTPRAMCGNFHSGPCHKASSACYECGQIGHLRRNCPFIQPVLSFGLIQTPPRPLIFAAQSMGETSASIGRGMSGKSTRKRGQSFFGQG